MSNQDPAAVPVTANAQALRERVSPARWERIVRDARARSATVKKVREKCAADGMTPYKALRIVSPRTHWATFQAWTKRVEKDGHSWESLADRRVPPKPRMIPESVRACAIAARRLRPDIGYNETVDHLVGQHGEVGRISHTSLHRIWVGAGLIEASPAVEEVVIEDFPGGAGLAFIRAAAEETGAAMSLAKSLKIEAQAVVDSQVAQNASFPAEPAGRDERGRLTSEYNHSTRAGVEAGESDPRWEPDYKKRTKRDLGRLQVMEHRAGTIADKLLCIGLTPLLTERRGFDGLDGPTGDWLGVLGGHPYKPATLDKLLSQLAFLDVEDVLWETHAGLAKDLIVRWTSAAGLPAWLQLVIYVDASQDAHWTHKYARSGKVSRTGRVGPCLSRVAVTGGPGVPLLVETYPGSVSLKTELPRLLERVDSYIGPGELGRLTIIDAEMATAKLLHALSRDPARSFITVLKGSSVPKKFKPSSEWQPFREHDEIREGEVIIHGKDAPKEGVKLRVVEMRRPGRHPHSTYFGSGGNDTKSMRTQEIPEAYLSRWPHQEQLFRNTRNGLGLDRTHGYAGEMVQHVAIDTKREKAERQLGRAQEREKAAQELLHKAEVSEKRAAKSRKKEAARVCALARVESKAAKAAVKSAQDHLEEIKTTPRVIYERDSARENVVTALKMTVMLLIEYVLREFFSGTRIELRTFIEHFVWVPVTRVTSRTEIRYQIHANPRNPERTEQIQKACKEVTRRKICQGNRALVFELVESQRKRVEVRRL